MEELQFDKEYTQLNEEQRQAVDHIYGPVMVVAGPGTGKTQILAMRIGQILRQTDADASNILCLTYTEAGTVAMRRRLIKLIGPTAYNVNIYTFHSFCNQVIQSYSNLFGDHHDLRPVDDLERLDLFIKLIDEWPNNHPLKKLKGDAYYYRTGLQDLFNTMKSEGWSSEYVLARIDQYIREMPDKKGMIYKRGQNEGQPTLKGQQKLKSLERLRAAANGFGTFNEHLLDAGRYDYADMILWVIDQMNQNEDLLFDLREQFQFILVDEYQDTNGAQNKILFQLCGDPDDQPNVFVVGDDDQAIYRFQGANLNNIIEFETRFGNYLRTIVLKENYRSSTRILNTAHSIIVNNKERLSTLNDSLDKKLVAGGVENSRYSTGVYIGNFESETEELLAVQKYVESLILQDVDPREIAILYRTRAHVAPLIKYFSTELIPHSVSEKKNVLVDPFVEKLIFILRYLQAEIEAPLEGDLSLFTILHYPWFNIAPIDISKLALALQSCENKNWRVQLNNAEWLAQLQLKSLAEVESCIKLIEEWIATGINDTIQVLFEHILYSLPIFNYIESSGQTYNYLRLANTFFNYIKDQSDKYESLHLDDFLVTLDKMINYEIKIPLEKIDRTGDGIQLLTAHGSKGLEFDHVIIIGANSRKWEDSKPPPPAFSYPDTLIRSNEENKVEDNRRLFYVGITRARKEVLITMSKEMLDGKAAAPSRFVIESETSGDTQPWTHASTSADRHRFLYSQFAPIKYEDKAIPAQVDDVIQNLILNISGVNKYLNCPVTYYYENILRSPLARTPAMGYGNAVHEAIERTFRHEDNKPGSFPDLTTLLFFFKKGMERFHAHFNSKEYKRYMANGKIRLAAYYDYHLVHWKSLDKSRLEYKVSNVHIDGIPVSGIFDRVDILNDRMVVVDYKTGNPKTGKAKTKPPVNDQSELQVQYSNSKDPEIRSKLRLKLHGGDYWRQAVFYKLLAAADNALSHPFDKAYISFVEADENKNYEHEVSITSSDEKTVLQQLKFVHEKVKNKDFSNGCGRTNCRWCQLLIQN